MDASFKALVAKSSKLKLVCWILNLLENISVHEGCFNSLHEDLVKGRKPLGSYLLFTIVSTGLDLLRVA